MKWIKRITLGGLATLGAVVLGIIAATFGVAVVQGWGEPRTIPGETDAYGYDELGFPMHAPA